MGFFLKLQNWYLISRMSGILSFDAGAVLIAQMISSIVTPTMEQRD